MLEKYHELVPFIRQLANKCCDKSMNLGEIVTICGRYYAMDRDKRWDRIKLAYDLYLNGEGEKFNDFHEVMSQSYKNKITDEFITPKINKNNKGIIKDNDAIVTFNFRSDRMRQIISSLTDKNFKGLFSDIFVTTTPLKFFGKLRLEISSLFKSLTEIFKASTIISSTGTFSMGFCCKSASNAPIRSM